MTNRLRVAWDVLDEMRTMDVCDGGFTHDVTNAIGAALREAEATRAALAKHVALLRSMEWAMQESCRNYKRADGDWDDGGMCPECLAAGPKTADAPWRIGHKPDCALAVLLDA